MSLTSFIITQTTCYTIHTCSSRNWTTPVTVDLRAGSVSIIVQAERHFLIADNVSGVQIISYEVRNLVWLQRVGIMMGIPA